MPKVTLVLLTLTICIGSVSAQSLVSVTPDEGNVEQSLQVIITGQGTHFTQGSAVVWFSQGSFTINPSGGIYASSPTELEVNNIYIPVDAPTGLYDVYCYTPLDGTLVLNDGFTVTDNPPQLTSISPEQSYQGRTSLYVNITGQNTHFNQGSSTTVVWFTQGSTTLNAYNVYAYSNTSVAMYVDIPIDAPLGDYDVFQYNPIDGMLMLNDGFTVVEDKPMLLSVSPDHGYQDESLRVYITGQRTRFNQASPVSVWFSQGSEIINAYNVWDFTNTELFADIDIQFDASPGLYDMYSNDSLNGTLVLPNSLEILGKPEIYSITPDAAQQGEQIGVDITGEYFTQRLSIYDTLNHVRLQKESQVIYADQFSTVNSQSITAEFNISSNISHGLYDLIANFGIDQKDAVLQQGFTVMSFPDFSGNGLVNQTDLISLADYWLLDTDCPLTDWQQQQKLMASAPQSDDFFGTSVSINGIYLVVGATEEFSNRNGSSYVFKQINGTWSLIQTLTASDGQPDDWFGFSVLTDGDHAVIGAVGDDDNGPNSGSVYIFKRTGETWIQQQKLTALDGSSNDRFGHSVSIDGDTAVIGAYGDDDNGPDSGSAYIFKRTGETWAQMQKLTALDGQSGDRFGYSISICGDYIIIGAIRDDDNGSWSGSAYIFKRVGGIWTQMQKITASDGATDDHFGVSVSIDGDTAVIGAYQDDDNGANSGSAYIFERNGETWTQHQKLTALDGEAHDHFGNSVSLDSDYIAIGARSGISYGSGAVYTFKRRSENWDEIQKLTVSDGAIYDNFGSFVSIEGDYLAVGSSYDETNGFGSAYIYQFANCPLQDINADGIIDMTDMSLFAQDWLTSQ